MTYGFDALHRMISRQQVSAASVCCQAGASRNNISARSDQCDGEQLCEYKLWVPGYRRLWGWNSQVSCIASDFSCNLQGAKRLLAPALAYGSARSPLLGLRNTTARASIPPLFSSSFIILATSTLVASYLLSSTSLVSSSTSYSSGRIVQLPTVSVPLRAVLTMSRSLSAHVPRLT